MESTIFIIAAILATYATNEITIRLAAPKMPATLFAALVFPGILVHEASHAIVGAILGLRINGFSISIKGRQLSGEGHVSLSGPEGLSTTIKFAVAAMAPLAGCGATIFFFATISGWPPLLATANSVFSSTGGSISLGAMLDILSQAGWGTWASVPLIYSLSLSAFPSWQDVKVAMPVLVPLGATSPWWFAEISTKVSTSMFSVACAISAISILSGITLTAVFIFMPKKKRG